MGVVVCYSGMGFQLRSVGEDGAVETAFIQACAATKSRGLIHSGQDESTGQLV